MDNRKEPGGETSSSLLWRARQGERTALNALFARYFPRLRRWAAGRLPRWARDMADTTDLVQESLFNAFRRLDRFEPRRKGALQAYLCEAVRNRLRDEMRRTSRSPKREELASDTLVDAQPSPLELAIGKEAAQRYLNALSRLRDDDQQAIVARVELGYSYDQIALVLGKATSDAARMVVTRALVRLAAEMGEGAGDARFDRGRDSTSSRSSREPSEHRAL